MMQHIKNIFYLGVKELIELFKDPLMVILIVYSFTLGVYVASKGMPDSIQNGAIAIVDEDGTQLSKRISDAFVPPMFRMPEKITRQEIDPAMDQGIYTFVLVIPSSFEKDLIGGRQPEIQLNVDATRMSQAFIGTGYIQQIIQKETGAFLQSDRGASSDPARLVIRNRFNPNLTVSWFSAINQLVNNITMLAIILTGAALIRERERGTLEHLLVMPVTPFEIMCAKIWSMMLIVLAASAVSVVIVIRGMLGVPVAGSVPLFILGVALHLFAATSLGIFLACVAQNMPQLGMLLILVLLPMNMLSGGMTPQESMPEIVRIIMSAAPTTHFVKFSEAILFRGAGFEVVWKPFLALAVIGGLLFWYSLTRFRKTAT